MYSSSQGGTVPVVDGTELSPANRSADKGPPAFRDSRPGFVSVMDCPGIQAAQTHIQSQPVVTGLKVCIVEKQYGKV